MSFSDELLNFRARNGLTQEQAAEVLDCSAVSISNWEKGGFDARQTRKIRVRLLMEKYEKERGN